MLDAIPADHQLSAAAGAGVQFNTADQAARIGGQLVFGRELRCIGQGTVPANRERDLQMVALGSRCVRAIGQAATEIDGQVQMISPLGHGTGYE